MNVTRLAFAIGLSFAALSFASADDRDSKTKAMVFVEGGTFEVGDVFDEGVRFAAPVHQVTVSSFYLNKYEVTVEEFAAFVEDASYVTSAEKECKDAAASASDEYSAQLASRGAFVLNPATGGMSWVTDANWKNAHFEQSPQDPVTCVSWRDAVSYCNWLSKNENLPIAYDVKTGALLDAHG